MQQHAGHNNGRRPHAPRPEKGKRDGGGERVRGEKTRQCSPAAPEGTRLCPRAATRLPDHLGANTLECM